MTQSPQAPLPHYGPAPAPYSPRPPRQPTTLWRPLVWTLCLSAVGAILMIAAVVALVLAIIVLFLVFVAALIDSYAVSDIFAGSWLRGLGELFGEWGAEFAVIIGIALVIGTVSLLLLRLIASFRTWPPFLQGLAASGVTYVVGSLTIAIALELV